MQKTVKAKNHGLVLFNPKIRPLSGATTPGQSGPGSDGNEGVLCIPQSSSIIGTLPSDCLVSYPGHSLVGGAYPSEEKQSVYSIALVDWATQQMKIEQIFNTSTRTHQISLKKLISRKAKTNPTKTRNSHRSI